MRIAKFFDTERFSLLSKAADTALLRIDYPWRFDRMAFLLDNNNFFEIKEETVEIHLDYGIVYHEDERYVKTSVMRILFSLINHLNGNSTGIRIIDDILANREMVRKGFGDDLFYYYYLKFFENKGIDNFEKYIEMSIPSLSLDGYDSQVIKEMMDKLPPPKYRKAFQRKARKLFAVLGEDLTDEIAMKEAIKWCKRKLGC